MRFTSLVFLLPMALAVPTPVPSVNDGEYIDTSRRYSRETILSASGSSLVRSNGSPLAPSGSSVLVSSGALCRLRPLANSDHRAGD